MYPIPANATRIRYLESTGTQYIDTGIAPGNNELDFAIDCANEQTSTSFQAAFGCRDNTNGTYVPQSYAMFLRSSDPECRIDICNSGAQKTMSIDVGTRYVISWDSDNLTLTKTVVSTGATGTATARTKGVCEYTFALFGINTNGTISSGASLRVYSAKFYKSGVLVRSFVPVRVGSTGYLFDRVSGQLFGNSGTGYFPLGPDSTIPQGVLPTRMMAMGVRKKPYEAEVEYLESTGTQYIDTGVVVSLVKAVAFDIEFTLSSMSSTSFIGSSARSGSSNAKKERFYGNATTSGGAVSSGYVDFGDVSEARVSLPSISSGARSVLQKHATNIASTTQTNGANVFVFCASTSNGSAPSSKVSARLYSCTIWGSEDTMLRDFIPVRVGSGANAVGYLFDRVSGTLFGNAGTGAFTIGPDK